MKIRYLFPGLYLLFISIGTGCKKDTAYPTLSVMRFFNAAVGITSIKANTTGQTIDFATTTDVINYGAMKAYTFPNATRNVNGVASADVSKMLFDFSYDFQAGSIYTLYTTGVAPNVENVFVEEQFPAYTELKMAVKVINLSPNCPTVDVNLLASPTKKEFSGVAYKQQSNYNIYDVGASVLVGGFRFEFRDAGGNLLATHNLSQQNFTASKYKSFNLVLRGLVGGTGANALGITFLPNY